MKAFLNFEIIHNYIFRFFLEKKNEKINKN